MENTIKPQKRISQRIAEFFFTLYMITLYIFVDREETVIISKVVFVLFAIFTVISVLRRKSIHIGKNVMSVYIAFTWMFATVFWAKNEYNATYMMKTMWQIFILFFLTYNLFAKEKDAHDKILKSLYVAGIVLLIYSIFIYGIMDVIKIMEVESNVRLGKEINQENSFGIMNATTTIVAFSYLLYKRKYKAFHSVMIVLSFFFAMASGSRKAVLMICIGAAILILKKYKLRYAHRAIARGMILLIVLLFVINLPIFDSINSRLEGMINLITGGGKVESSVNLRWEMIVDGWEAFKERFLMGYGANNYRNIARYKTYSHNNFIEILVDFGVVGFFLYYLIYFMAFKNLWKSEHGAGKALLSIFFVRFIMEIAFVTYYSKTQWVLMAFFLINVSQEQEKQKNTADCLLQENKEDSSSDPADDTVVVQNEI